MIPNKFNGYSPDGRRLYYKGGGGGGKAVIGLVAAIAAPWAVPALASAMSVSSVVAGAAYGAAAGGLSTGSVKGALTGGIIGGVGGYFGGGAGAGAAEGTAAGVSADPSAWAGFDAAQGVTSLPGFETAATAVNAPVAGSFDAGLTGGAQGAQAGSFDAGLTGGAQGGAPTLASPPQAGLAAPSGPTLTAGPQASNAAYQGDAGFDAGMTGKDYASLNSAAPTASTPGWGSKMLSGLTNPENLASAGLRLGTQFLGGAMSKPDTGNLESYLDDMRGQQATANAFNMNQAEKKNAVGDKMVQTADNYDPGYMAGLSYANTTNANALGSKQRLDQARARGASPEELNALANEAQVAGTGQANAAWNSGMASAKGTQAGLYSSAGSMYGQVTPPSAGLSGAYNSVADMNQRAKSAGGYALEQAFEPLTKTTKTGAATTTG